MVDIMEKVDSLDSAIQKVSATLKRLTLILFLLDFSLTIKAKREHLAFFLRWEM